MDGRSPGADPGTARVQESWTVPRRPVTRTMESTGGPTIPQPPSRLACDPQLQRQIRFCGTPACVRVAYATVGRGPALLVPAAWISHLELWRQDPAYRALFAPLTGVRTVVQYDRPGCGLSEPWPGRQTLGTELEVLQAVADHLELDRLDLLGASMGAPVALAFAAAHPARVARLVIYGGYADGRRIATAEVRTGMTERYFRRRFCGPPGMANGGFACGSIAALHGGAAEVTLRLPLPLERPLAARHDGHGALLVRDGDTLLAESHSAAPVELAAQAVSLDEARAVAGRSRYYTDPVFPACFVCGMDRRPGDGGRIFPGPVSGRALWAAPWTPDPSVASSDRSIRPEVIWAALDCPSGLAAAEASGLAQDTVILLGRMTVSLAGLPLASSERSPKESFYGTEPVRCQLLNLHAALPGPSLGSVSPGAK